MQRLIAVGLMYFAFAASAQQFPSKSVTILVPFSAGGPTDTVARVTGTAMSRPLGQSVVVENRPSAGGILGAELVAKARPDGYTVLLHHIGMATAPSLYRNLRYKPTEDFDPIGLINEVPMTLIARSDLPPNGLKDLIRYVKANKDKMTYANAGVGAASHLCGMLLMSAIEADILTVPYKGTAPAMTDLLGGRVDLLCDQTTNTTSQIKAGKVKIYGVTTKVRVPTLPDVPTLEEQGLAGFDVSVWHALYAPKGTPKPVIDRLAAALQEALRDSSVKQRFNELGTDTVPPARATPAALALHLKNETERWAPLIRKAGVYAD